LRHGYLLCGLAADEGYVALIGKGLPPASLRAADWSSFPLIEKPQALTQGIYFLLRVPGNAAGLYRALERAMDVSGIYRDGYEGLENHRTLLAAVLSVRNGATDFVGVAFTLSPEQLRADQMEHFQQEQKYWWQSHIECLNDPGCAEVYRRDY